MEEYVRPIVYIFTSAYGVLVIGVALTIMSFVHLKEMNDLKKHYWVPILIMYVTLMVFIVLSYTMQGTTAQYF